MESMRVVGRCNNKFYVSLNENSPDVRNILSGFVVCGLRDEKFLRNFYVNQQFISTTSIITYFPFIDSAIHIHRSLSARSFSLRRTQLLRDDGE